MNMRIHDLKRGTIIRVIKSKLFGKISNKITLSIVISSILIIVSIGYVSLKVSREILLKEAHENLTNIVVEEGHAIEASTKNLEHMTRMMQRLVIDELDVESVRQDPEAMEAFKERLNQNILGIIETFDNASGWVIFNSQIIPGANTMEFARIGGDGAYERKVEFDPLAIGEENAEWWRRPIDQGEAWTLPYYWEPWDAVIISFGKRLEINGLVVGVTGGEFFIEKLQERLSQVRIYDSGTLMLLNRNMDFYYHPDSEAKGLKTYQEGYYNKLAETIEQSNIKTNVLEYKGELFAYYKVNNGWTVLVDPVEAEIFEDLNRLTMNIVAIALLASIMAVVLSIVLGKSITEPIRVLKEGVDALASGEYDMRVSIESFDEIGDLADDFNAMSQHLFESDKEIHQLNLGLEKKVEARTMELAQSNEELKASMESLEETQKKLKKSNKNLSFALANLYETKDQLIQSGKMAALGELVAGVAHEINTPVGVCVTLSTYLSSEIERVKTEVSLGQTTKKLMLEDLTAFEEASTSIQRNLKNTGELIKSFKLVAVDQTSQQHREFNLKSYIDETFLNMRSHYKNRPISIINNCPEDIELNSYPGAFSQIFTNFMMNTFLHGFDGREGGVIDVEAAIFMDRIKLKYSDDGKGIPEENIHRIFDPFFTTKRGKGGTGLGLNIVYNLVINVLGGKVTCESKVGEYTRFVIDIPLLPPDHPDLEKSNEKFI